ncbi:hypothetical protein ACMV8I_18745 [Ewingella sp. S1.OA.A_B6]
MKITIDDYEVINRYSGTDRSWHDRVSTKEGLDRLKNFSKVIASTAVIAARYESKEQGDGH